MRSTQGQGRVVSQSLPSSAAMSFRVPRRKARFRSLSFLFFLICLLAVTFMMLLGGLPRASRLVPLSLHTGKPPSAPLTNNATSPREYGVMRDGPASVTSSQRCRKEIRHVAFVKVHKTGSSTVANILQRFGIQRKLSFVLPRKKFHEDGYNYIGQRGVKVPREVIQKIILPPPPGRDYDLLWNHVVYDREAFRSIMPNDTVFVAILREPFQQFLSAFEYFGKTGYLANVLRLKVGNPIATFLHSPHRYLPPWPHFNNVRNKQALDLGMEERHLKSWEEGQAYIQQLDRDFDMVILTEFFDESLVLLRRRLCWSLKDILYVAHNRNPRKNIRPFRDQDLARHREYSPLDYDLYQHFHKRLWERVWAAGPDIFHEVRHFRDVLRRTLDHCSLGEELHVAASPWNEEFKVTREDCRLMLLSELPFFDKLLEDRFSSMNDSQPEKSAYLREKVAAQAKWREQVLRMRNSRRGRWRDPRARMMERRKTRSKGRELGSPSGKMAPAELTALARKVPAGSEAVLGRKAEKGAQPSAYRLRRPGVVYPASNATGVRTVPVNSQSKP